MSTTTVPTPTSRLRFGIARADITPPVGIYQGFWGAARHDRATGVHRPLSAEVLAFAPLSGAGLLIRATTDLIGLSPREHEALAGVIAAAAGVARGAVALTYSHSHSSGWLMADRASLPGGELIAPYLAGLRATLAEATREAVGGLREATIGYARGRCDVARNRDYWDDAAGGYCCGFNPDTPADDTVIVGRVTDVAGAILAIVVNYACHPTTLAWQNTLLSPDFAGSLREEVERATGATCVYLQGACGDLGPREGFLGDLGVADGNGRQIAYAALAALASLGPPDHDFHYAGPVVSGATLGTWEYRPHDAARASATARFGGGAGAVDLPMRQRPTRVGLEADLARILAERDAADARGDTAAARDAHAHSERVRRWLGRLDEFPAGPTLPHPFTVQRLGDAVWVTCGGEPYNWLQLELRDRFPAWTILVSPLDGPLHTAYLLPRDRYGRGLYQEQPSILAPGCLESLADAIAERIAG